MEVIRDNEMCGIMMIPLFTKFGIKRCNVSGCENKPSTIIKNCPTGAGDNCDFALCEHHYQESVQKGEISYRLDFDYIQ